MAPEKMEFINFIRIQKFILVNLGLWPKKQVNLATLYYLNALVTCFGVSYSFLLTLSLDMFINSQNKENLADASYYFLTQLTFVVKFTIFVLKRQKFLQILSTLDSDIFNQTKNHEIRVKKWYKFSDLFIKNYLLICYTVWVFYTIFPIIDKDENNILPFKAWFPFDVKNNIINRRVVYAFQVFGLGSAIAINVSLDSVLTALLNIGSAQIEILKSNLENASNFSEKEIYSEEKFYQDHNVELIPKEIDENILKILEKCVEHHLTIIKFLNDVESVFGLGMFMQFVSSGIIICITGLQLILVPTNSIKFYSIISYFFAIIVQISAYCWNGNDVIVQSSDIASSCYKMDWYRTSPRVKQMLFTIMERSKIPLKISAGKFFILSITTLTMIFRTAYSYFAVLQRLYQDK